MLDLGIGKHVRFGGRRLEGRIEAFNITNHLNPASVNNTYGPNALVPRADFLAVNTDWGRGAVGAFGDLLKRSGGQVGTAEFMGFGGIECGVNPAKNNVSAAAARYLANLVSTQRVGGMNADAHNIPRLNAFGHNRFQSFIDDVGIAVC